MLEVKIGKSAILPEGLLLGHAQDEAAATGCTVILCPEGGLGAVAVRGAAPATRETDLLAPENTVEVVHAVLLSGGSAFGLDAATGIMRYLESQNIGFALADVVVPIVVGASIFDLDVGSATVRPDANMGYNAAAQATAEIGETGNVGAGTGACVGRFMGPDAAMKGGLGIASVQSAGLLVTAVVAVNSLGNIYDRKLGSYIAGAHLPVQPVATKAGQAEAQGSTVSVGLGGTSQKAEATLIVEPLEILPDLMMAMATQQTNTTIGVVATNAILTKPLALRVASMAHDGMARAIYPAHTSFDGDALFTLATGKVPAHPDVVGALAALAVEQAILDAVLSAKSAYGFAAVSSFAGENLTI